MIDKIRNVDLSQYHITVMPDFFIDRIIRLQSFQEFSSIVDEKEKFGGGAIRNILTNDVKGGNAVNIAYCLCKLGINVSLFTIADEIGNAILKQVFSKFQNNKINLHIVKGKNGRTTALEFRENNGKRMNIMFNDVGDISKFGPEKIDSIETKNILQQSDGVMVVNWSSNLRGSELMEYAFENSPNAIHFIDPADLNNRSKEFKEILTKFNKLIDILSINENECNSILSNYHINFFDYIEKKNKIEIFKEYIRKLVEYTKTKNIYLHTSEAAIWSNGNDSEYVKSFKVKPITLTGAGDAWNSANILGHLIRLSEKEILTLSNAYAALFVSNPISEPPYMDDLLQFLDTQFNKMDEA